MVGGINLNATTPISAQISVARRENVMLQPGESFHSEEETSSIVSVASTAMVPIATGASERPNETEPGISALPTPASQNKKLSAGAISGMTIAAVIVFAMVGALIWFMHRSRALKQQLNVSRRAEEQTVVPLQSDHNAMSARSYVNPPISPLGPMVYGGLTEGGTSSWSDPRYTGGSYQSSHNIAGSIGDTVSPIQARTSSAAWHAIELETKSAKSGHVSTHPTMIRMLTRPAGVPRLGSRQQYRRLLVTSLSGMKWRTLAVSEGLVAQTIHSPRGNLLEYQGALFVARLMGIAASET